MLRRESSVLLWLLCGGLPCAAFAPIARLIAPVNEACSRSCSLRLFAHDEDNVEASHHTSGALPSRRQAISSLTGAIVGLAGASRTDAAVTDETDAFANTSSDSAYRGLQSTRTMGGISQSTAIPSDEVVISIPKSELASKGGLGIELSQIDFRTMSRVYVKSVEPGSVAAKLGIKKDFIVVSVNGKSAERTNTEGVAILVYEASKSKPADGSVEFRFRDPSLFREKLNDLSTTGEVTTQIAPAGDTTQRKLDGSVKAGRVVTQQTDQRLTVTQLIPPKMCNRKAETDDLLEISYVGMVVETGQIFDGSAVKINGEGIPGRGNDVSLYFVLKKQPFGQFPPGFDVGLEGMCVGERRRLIIPPALAYGSKGVPKRNIPPDATLQYDITLVSLNGLATPQ